MSSRISLATLLALALLAPVHTAPVGADAAADEPPAVAIEVRSNRADLISGGDALVEIRVAEGLDVALVRASVNGRDVTSAFTLDADGRLTGLVEGLALGRNRLRAWVVGTLDDAEITITNHPIGGPVISGTQVQPWRCETIENGLGPAVDEQCNAAPIQRDVLLANGVRVTVERGTMNRGIYDVVMPADWNGKLIWAFGAGTGQHYRQGTPGTLIPGVPVPLGTALGLLNEATREGYALVTSSMTDNNQHSNDVTSAEMVMMVKEHITEQYGEIRWTIGQGQSGGALQQYLIADAYPGLLDGLLPAQDWQDQIVGAYREFADCALLVRHMDASPLWDDSSERTAVFGHGGTGVCSTSTGRAPDYMAPDDGTSCAGEDSYATDNPGGVRCTLQDLNVSIYGVRPEGCDGQGLPCARRPWDNVGVQYGLRALEAGVITPEQFVDLNAGIGGYDINMQWTQARTEGDVAAIDTAHRTGRVTFGRGLAQVPMLIAGSTNNNDYHYPWRSWVTRARLVRANGHHENHIIWTGGTDGSTLDAMDAWLSAIEADTSHDPLEEKVIRNRPAHVVDACWIGGQKITGDQAACDEAYPYRSDTRVVAGEGPTSDILKCQLKPLDPSDYSVTFTDDEWAALRTAFPSGVCDWSKPGVGQVDAEGMPAAPSTWVTFADGPGGRPLGAAPVSS